MNNVTVFGLGRVGLPVAAASVKAGFKTCGVDISPERVQEIRQGSSPWNDLSLNEATLTEINATTEPAEVLPGTDVVLVCVPSPLDSQYRIDLSNIEAVFNTLADSIDQDTLVVIESTIPPGTTEKIGQTMISKANIPEEDVLLAHCPERIDPGNEAWPLKSIPRVLGGVNDRASKKTTEFYEQLLDAEIYPVSNARTAACTKIIENAFRDINIAFVNEIARSLADTTVDVYEVLEGAETKPYGYMKFTPGPGVGGHCIPIDPYMLINQAKQNGFDHEFLRLARHINDDMAKFVVSQYQNVLNEIGYPVKGTQILQLGLSFKSGIGDTRTSPAVDVGKRLDELGGCVEQYDPYLLAESSVETPYIEAESAVVLTGHPDFCSLNHERLAANGIELIYDACNVIDSQAVTAAGMTYANLAGTSGPK